MNERRLIICAAACLCLALAGAIVIAVRLDAAPPSGDAVGIASAIALLVGVALGSR